MVTLKEWKKKQQQAYLALGYNTLQKNQLVFSNTKSSFIQPTKTNDWLKSIINKTVFLLFPHLDLDILIVLYF